MPALDTFFGELHSLSAFEQAPAPGLILDHVAQEKLPLALEGIVVGVLLRDLLPAFEIVERAVHVGIPNGARGVAVVLCPAVAQTGDSGALGAIHLNGEQVVAAHADGPGRIEVGDYGLMEMPSNVEALSPEVRTSGEETFDIVVKAMKVRGVNFTEVTPAQNLDIFWTVITATAERQDAIEMQVRRRFANSALAFVSIKDRFSNFPRYVSAT